MHNHKAEREALSALFFLVGMVVGIKKLKEKPLTMFTVRGCILWLRGKDLNQ